MVNRRKMRDAKLIALMGQMDSLPQAITESVEPVERDETDMDVLKLHGQSKKDVMIELVDYFLKQADNRIVVTVPSQFVETRDGENYFKIPEGKRMLTNFKEQFIANIMKQLGYDDDELKKEMVVYIENVELAFQIGNS